MWKVCVMSDMYYANKNKKNRKDEKNASGIILMISQDRFLWKGSCLLKEIKEGRGDNIAERRNIHLKCIWSKNVPGLVHKQQGGWYFWDGVREWIADDTDLLKQKMEINNLDYF